MTEVRPIPLIDLGAQHVEIADEVAAGFSRVIATSGYILGEDVGAFEREFAEFCDSRYCVGVANGTDALELSLRALGVAVGDEVVVPANTFIATALAVTRIGARPVLVDCDRFFLMDPGALEASVTSRTAAIVPVHLYGQMADLEAIERVAARHAIPIVEDAAQAHGASRQGRRAGSVGALAGTSFYPGKNIGAYGDAGAVLTSSAELAGRVRRLRNWGSEQKYEHLEIGFNSRLDTLQAVVLRAKLRRLSRWNEGRRAAARRYDELLAGVGEIECPQTSPGNEHVYHLYVVRVPRRDAVLAQLHAVGIGAGVHYPKPLHLQGAFRSLGYSAGAFPMAEMACAQLLSLPLCPYITAAAQERVATELVSILRA